MRARFPVIRRDFLFGASAGTIRRNGPRKEPAVTDHSTPMWVRRRDGRLVPFDADRVGRTLFAAAAALGRPDAFLARELTDSVAHFLRAEAGAAPPTTAELAETIVKLVRELGQPELAR